MTVQKCAAKTLRRGGAPCRNDAVVNGLCLDHHKMQQRGKPVIQDADWQEVPSTPPVDAPAPDDTHDAAPMDLPAAPALEREAVAAGAAERPRSLNDLDAIAGKLFGEVPVDAAAADAAAADTPPIRPVDGGGMYAAGTWTPQRLEGILRMAINPRLVATGKEPLSDEELREGSAIGARIMSDLFSDRGLESPYAALGVWCLVVFGTRYADELAGVVRSMVLRRRGLSAPAAAAPTGAATDPPAESLATGWGTAA